MPDAGGAYVYIREGVRPAARVSVRLDGAAQHRDRCARRGRVRLRRLRGPVREPRAAWRTDLASRRRTIAPADGDELLGIKPGAIVQNVLAVAKISALAVLIVGGLVLWAKVGRAAAGGERARAARVAREWPRRRVRRRPVHDRRLAADEHGGGGDSSDPARTIPRALALGIGIVIACYLGRERRLPARVRPGRARREQRGGGGYGDAARRVDGRDAHHGRGDALDPWVRQCGDPRDATDLFRHGARRRRSCRPRRAYIRGSGRPTSRSSSWGSWAIASACDHAGARSATLLSGVVFADWIFFGLGAASVFALRRSRPDAPRPYRAWGYPIVPGFFVVAAMLGS